MPAASPDNLPSRDVPLRHGPTLPPLHDRRTRTRLLLGSLLDALHPVLDARTRGRPEDRNLAAHNLELWPYGSYPELVKALDDLRALGRRRRYWHRCHQSTWSVHVCQVKPDKEATAQQAVNGVAWIARAMPEFIYVPVIISYEVYGYSLAEARQYEKVRSGVYLE